MHGLILALTACSPATLGEAAAAAAGTEDGLSIMGSGDAPSAESSTQPFVRGASRAEADEQIRLVFQGTPTIAMRRPKPAWQGSPGSSGTPAGIRVWTPQQDSEHERWELGRAPSGEDGGAQPASGPSRAGSGSHGSVDPKRMEPLREGLMLDESLAEEPGKGVMHAPPPRDGSADAPEGGGLEPDLAWPAPPERHERPGARGDHRSGEDLVRQSSKVWELALSSVTLQ